ncbi:tRNA (N(6)-L-threonylcarbamoyladenosine(37)-C(2))-methylthiotransferase [Candidatus Woesearchaeota archaeon]|nr:tRNA (N(6)-L-threonylcarbamoyladenosine(37)-C(2))-methylthiotransferase [Candidatus Woesearchaeota archaeon]
MTSFYIHTSGCSANQADSEQMAGLLQQAQFELASSMDDAHIVIFNTCTVKSPSEMDFFHTLEQFRKQYPHKIVVITGCIPQADPQKLKEYSLIGTKQIHNIVQVVEEALHDNVLQMLNDDEMPPLNLPRVRKNPIVEILPINRGCLGACTFCKTKKARGSLVSYPLSEIIPEVTTALRQGVKEIWLTSQDTFCYGFDIGTDLPTLLQHLVALPGDFKIRVGMGNPDHMLKIGDRLIEMYKNPKIFKFSHLPLQAGHDDVLEHMRRHYTVNDFCYTVRKFRKEIPELNLMTDIIVGYPIETEEHFWGTLEVVRKVTPDSINISRFWPRPGTPAAELNELPGDVVKHRSRVLTDIFHNISLLQNERWLGWKGTIIIDDQGMEKNQWIGRNYAYKPVLVEGNYKLGDIISVQIKKAQKFDLVGEVV